MDPMENSDFGTQKAMELWSQFGSQPFMFTDRVSCWEDSKKIVPPMLEAWFTLPESNIFEFTPGKLMVGR